jgi:predicted nucleotidyltransferase
VKILNTDFQLIWYYNDNLERVYNKQLNRIDVHQYNILKPVNFAFLIQLGAKIEDATKKNKIDNTRTINSIKSRIFFIKNR